MVSAAFPHLFSPIRIGNITVRNRIMVPPHGAGYTDANWLPTDRLIAYWEAKAKGGVGMVCTGVTPIHSSMGMGVPWTNPDAWAPYRKAAEAVQRHGAKFFVQIWHGGSQVGGMLGARVWGPSTVASPDPWATPHRMTEKEIWDMIDSYARGAEAAREWGADGVEIHGAHGYLITAFTSGFFNQRDDDWGGSLENRVRFVDEVVNAVRTRVGKDFPVGLRFTADEFVDGGLTTEESKRILGPLAATGKLDYINISVGNYFTKQVIIAPNYVPLGAFVHTAAAIKEVVDIPVLAVGRIIDPVQAEQIIASGYADMVAMNRAIIADPEFANKAREGRAEEIRKCLGCNEACWGMGALGLGGGVGCVVNPDIGYEATNDYSPTAHPKKVLVIGGGVAGMEAAVVATTRGHKVTLCERSNELGGQVNIAAKAPGRIDMADSARFLQSELARLKVDVRLATEATLETIREMSPDAIVVATGATGYIPDNFEVGDGSAICESAQVLQGQVTPGKRILVVAGDRHMRAMTTIDFLLEKGCEVEAITDSFSFGEQVEEITWKVVSERIHEKGVRLTPLTALQSVDGNRVRLRHLLSGQEEERQVDTVVFAIGAKSNDRLLREIQGKTEAQVIGVGDCLAPRRIVWAIRDGARVGREL